MRELTVPYPGGSLRFGRRTLVMGVLNVTPDSFSDGGRHFDARRAIAAGQAMGDADILDIGGESTRPGAAPVSIEEEIRRVVPVIRALRKRFVSIDTSKPEVAEAAIAAGARMINDVTALADPRMARIAARAKVLVILMHMQGTPRTMQKRPRYRNVVKEVLAFLRQRVDAAVRAGIDRRRLLIDPGIGFGKTLAHNLEILRRVGEFRVLRLPLVLGTSRKAFIGKITGRTAGERRDGTAATVALGIAKGADIVRVHDVKEMADVARVADAICRT